MPSDRVHDILLREVTPARRQRGSGHLVVWVRQPVLPEGAQSPNLALHANWFRAGWTCASI